MIRLDNSKLLSMAGATMLLLIALSPVSAPKAQGLAADFSSGSVIIGEDADACDNSKEGGMRYNSASGLHQFCNGLGWAGFVANPPSVLLGIIPSSNFTMDVIGPGNPAYGATETFTVKNFGTTTSSNLTVDLTESADQFDIMSDACTGVALAEGQTCDITIRPKSTANALFSGTLTIPQNNIPMAPLKGVAQGFGCAPGVTGGGGVYAACGAAYNLVAVPGGCTDSATPTCAGGTDSTFKVWGSSGLLRDKTYDSLNGPQNNVNLMAYVAQEGSGAHLAAEFCRNMAYGGFSDWYLPSDSELLVLYGARSAIGGWASGFSYWSSTQIDSTYAYTRDPSGASVSAAKGSSYRVRCVRRETQALPAAQYDLKPDNVFFTPAMTTTGNRVSSNLATISGVSADISVAIANDTSGGARIKINGGAEVTSGTAGYGDTIQVVMTAPGSAGNANTVDVALGENTARWKVGVPNETGTRRVFVSESSSGGIGGANSGDARCQSEAAAAGLGGTWQAMISELNSATNQAALRMDFNWDTIVNMNGQTVATSWGDLWDGSIANPVNYDENGVLVSTTTAVYTGTSTTGVPATSSRDCSNWLSTVSTTTGTTGLLTGTNGSWIANTGTACNNSARLYCFEQVPGPGDTTPDPFSYNPMTAQAAASTVDVTAASVVISGINAAAGVSVSGSGNPEYRINAGSWTSTSGTLNNGDTLTIRADAPASNGARNKVTITAGTYTTYWYVGAGNTGNTKRIFVTATTYNGNRAGLGGADSTCSSLANAAGLGTGWVALMSDSGADGYAINRAPLNWGTLTNMNGDVVAASWADLWDGSVSAPINRSQTNTIVNNFVWTATGGNGRLIGTQTCLDWTTSSNSNSYATRLGSSGSSGSWVDSSQSSTCDIVRSLYCIEQ